MHRFPIICRNHFDRIPGTAIEKRPIRAFARTLLTSDAEIRIDFDAAERRMIGVGYPKHTGLDGTVFDASGRAGAASTAISCDREDAWLLLALRLTVADRHRPLFF